jgi:phosphoesterase RecJ-like protein
MNGSSADSTRDGTANVPAQVVDAINRMRRPIVLAHVRPDADALGSMFSIALAWTSDAVAPRVALPPGSLSQRLAFLFDMVDLPVATLEDFAHADGFVVLDAAKQSRCNVGTELKETDWRRDRPLVNIDHHGTNTMYGSLNWVVADASSTSELVYCLLRAAGKEITPVIAALLFAGIQTDTSGFALSNTTPSALQVAGELARAGVDVGDLGERLCHSQSQSEFDLLRVIYDNTKVVADGRIAYSTADYEEITGSGCTAADIDDQINVVRALNGVQLAMLFTEGEPGKTRINFRGCGGVTVVELAGRFNGGGHAGAAGAVVDSGLEETVRRVVPAAIEHLRTLFPLAP